MTAYLVADIVEVTDPAVMAEYGGAARATIEAHGGRVVAAEAGDALEGDWTPGRLVIIAFDSMDTLKGWYESPEYQEVLPLRLKASRSNIVALNGL